MSDHTHGLVPGQVYMYACRPYAFEHHSIIVKNSMFAPIIATLPFSTMSIVGFGSVAIIWVFNLIFAQDEIFNSKNWDFQR